MKILEEIFDQQSRHFDVEAKTNIGENVFDLALEFGGWLDPAWMWGLLLRHPVIRRMVNVRNKEGDNFVFQAIKMNKLHIVGLLLQHP